MPKISSTIRNEQGAILIMAALTLMGVVLVLGMVLDSGRVIMTKNELQSLTDAAAFAGAKELGAIYTENSLSAQQVYSLDAADYNRIRDVVRNVGSQHQAGGKAMIDIDPNEIGDVIVGDWDITNSQFTAQGLGTVRPNAVQVRARRDSSANEPLALIFGQIVNRSESNLDALATAGLSALIRVPPGTPPNPPNNLPPGDIIFPIGIDVEYNNGDPCTPPTLPPLPPGSALCLDGTFPFFACILLDKDDNPTNTCTAYTTFENPLETAFSNIVQTPIYSPMTRTQDDGDSSESVNPIPATGIHSFYFHGDADAVTDILQSHPDFDPANPSTYLEAVVPVYDDPNNNCTGVGATAPAPGTLLPIVGFTTVRMTSRFDDINIKFVCDVAATGRSGDTQYFGTWGSEPVLMQ